ncbi:hypothetical protein GH714_040876 [Hevea brasiliensis]|uniref:Disease resistance RPP13-like protein 1 n=1 Tax=Hevea brasiliensis TaxID=3981 RepID=A0A6A6MQL9_HEVBR|nr:hypothetical protein GH714_040876 [Hevea brasiliensis]
MAEGLVGGAILSAFLPVLFDRMASKEFLHFFKGRKLNDGLLNRLKTTLNSVNGLLADAEEKQITQAAVKIWLDDLKEAVYEADDLLDEIAYKALQSKLEPASRRRNKDTLRLIEGVGGKLSSLKTPTTSLPDDDQSSIYGRNVDKEAIIKFLLSDSSVNVRINVIPIVGMGGVGKTTLAQLVYNDISVREHFQLRAWVCVSEAFDVLKITEDILKEISSGSHNDKTMNQLQLQLKEGLSGRKYLLVLDDLWNEEYADWRYLLKPLIHGENGSMIIFTTRNESKTLGGLLRYERDVGKWEKISKSNIWGLSNGNILPALRLSYHHLPSLLKQCFAYCAIFPKDYEFGKEEVVHLWMAEGFLGDEQMEEVGNECFDDLVSRSLFQGSSSRKSHFVMHDLINDLAKFVSGEFCFRFEEGDNSCKIVNRTRHFSFAKSEYGIFNNFPDIYEANICALSYIWSHMRRQRRGEGHLSNMRNLQEVEEAKDALEANLKGKEKIKKLELTWQRYAGTDSENERLVLESLQPHTGLEHLSIHGYGGTSFPIWLDSLEYLTIEDFDRVEVIGPEFYGSCTSIKKPFRSLKVLKFKYMSRWSEWISCEGAFPLLEELHVEGSANLQKVTLPSHLPSLKILDVGECKQFASALNKAPAILKVSTLDMKLEKLPSGLFSLTSYEFDFEMELKETIGALPNDLEKLFSSTAFHSAFH